MPNTIPFLAFLEQESSEAAAPHQHFINPYFQIGVALKSKSSTSEEFREPLVTALQCTTPAQPVVPLLLVQLQLLQLTMLLLKNSLIYTRGSELRQLTSSAASVSSSGSFCWKARISVKKEPQSVGSEDGNLYSCLEPRISTPALCK